MKIKGKVSRTFHSSDNGFKIIVLDLSKNCTIPEKYRNLNTSHKTEHLGRTD